MTSFDQTADDRRHTGDGKRRTTADGRQTTDSEGPPSTSLPPSSALRPPSSGIRRPSSELDHFRAKTKRLKVHPAETAVLWIVCAHLIFLPWALGGMRAWAQWISLGLSVLTMIVALMPRDYTAEHTGANSFRLIPWPKLLKFPIFWIGLALLGLVTTQALNPAWSYVTDGNGWWMQLRSPVKWLPTGVDVPFERWGPWRMLLIYSSVWLTVCAMWIAFTRRRTLQRFFIVLAANGIALSALGMAQRFLPSREMFWFWTPPPNAAFFSSFIYKNHAGAYLLLALTLTAGLTLWYYFRGVRRLEKSNPAGLFAFFAMLTTISILVSYARGATLTTLTFLSVLVVGFFVQQFSTAKDRRKPIVMAVLLVVFGVFLTIGYKALNIDETWRRISRGFSEGTDYSYRSRQIADQASIDMLKEHWPMGAGAGTFRFLFPVYQQKYPEIVTFPGTNRRQYWQHAHNDILEFPIELGLPGMLLALAAAVYWAVTLTRYYFWQNPLSLVVVFGCGALAAYSWWDFPLQCPAVLMLWCVLWPGAAKWAALEERR